MAGGSRQNRVSREGAKLAKKSAFVPWRAWRLWVRLQLSLSTNYLTKVLFILKIRLADRYGSVYETLSICCCRRIDARCLRIRGR